MTLSNSFITEWLCVLESDQNGSSLRQVSYMSERFGDEVSNKVVVCFNSECEECFIFLCNVVQVPCVSCALVISV